MAATGTNTGLFNFQSILKEFYEWKPDPEDKAAVAQKQAFLADNVQSVLNNMMAKDLAYSNAEVASGQMSTAAKLESANQSIARKEDHDYGMQRMGAEYDYQSQFAVDEANRALNAASQAGDIAQNQTKLEGSENRLNIAAQGREEINKIGAQGVVDQANIKEQGNVDVNKIGAQGQVDINKIGAQGKNDLANIKAQGNVDIGKIGAQGVVDENNIYAKGNVDKANIAAQGDQDVRKIDAQGFMDQALEKVKGTETRTTMEQQTIEDGKTAARQSKYARGLAGMF